MKEVICCDVRVIWKCDNSISKETLMSDICILSRLQLSCNYYLLSVTLLLTIENGQYLIHNQKIIFCFSLMNIHVPLQIDIYDIV